MRPHTRHLEENTLELAKKIRRLRAAEAADDTVDTPRDINHWFIPGAVLATAALWIATAVALADTHGDPTTGDTLLLVTGAAVAAATTALYTRDYLLQRNMARDHRTILQELDKLRQEVAHNREVWTGLMSEALDKLRDIENARWEDAADQVRAIVTADGTSAGTSAGRGVGADGADILRMTRRPGS